MPPVTEVTKNLITQFLIPVIASIIGGWIGVQVTLATMAEKLTSITARVDKIELSSEFARGEHNEFRERIAKLEARQEHLLLRLKIEGLEK